MTPIETPPAPPPSRRRFQEILIQGFGAMIGLALAIPSAMYLLSPPKPKRESDWVDAGDISSLAPNTPSEISFRQKRTDGWRQISEKKTAWVVKTADNGIIAFGPQCTHLGCAYHWDEEKTQFVCPCHTTLFSIDGKVLSGPAPRPLDRYETRMNGKSLLLGPLHPVDGSKV